MGPAEQQDRLGEQLGTEPCSRAHPSQTVEHGKERLQGTNTLVRLFTGEQSRQALSGELGSGSTGEDPEANQNALLRGRTAHENRAMTIEERQVEDPLYQPPRPFANAGPRDSVAAGRSCNRHSLLNFRHRPQNVGDVIGLARKQIARQNTLARTTQSTAGQPDTQPPMARGSLHAPLNPAAGQGKLIRAAARAHTTAKNRVVCARQNLGVACRLHGKYVDHRVPSRRLRGFSTKMPGAVALSAPWGLDDQGKDNDGGRSKATGCDSHNAGVTTSQMV